MLPIEPPAEPPPPPPPEASVEAAVDIPPPPPEEPPAEAAPPPASSDDEIIVTGTRIKRSQTFVSSAPVEVIDRKQLEFIGANNLADVVSYLTIAPGSVLGGAVTVNLRGLGGGATLVLLNGRRMLPSASGAVTEQAADLSTIPLTAVERVEILKGGASAIYGADAVGGVVNIITRRGFDGVRIEVDADATEEFDWDQEVTSITIGSKGERARVMASLQYSRSSELLSQDRDFTKGKAISTQGNPGSFIVGTGVVPDPDCEASPYSSLSMGATGTTCAFDFRDFRSMLGNSDRALGFAQGEFDVTGHTTLYSELLVSKLRGDSISSPSFPVPPPFPLVPANHVDNPFGQDVQFIGRPVGGEHGPAHSTSDDDSFRGVVGIKGDLEGAAADTFLESWEWDLYFTAGVSRNRLGVADNLRAELQDGLNSCSDPSDLSRCYNPFYSSVLGTGTPNSDAVIARISGRMASLTDQAMQTYNAGMNGSLFELPGGDVGLAFGGEIRHERRSSELDHDATQERYGFLIGTSGAEVSRDVHSGYLELSLPFYDGIELTGAGRLEHYTLTDNTELSPAAGLTIVPSDIVGRDNVAPAFQRLQLRGHVTRAFRAPTLYQAFPGFAVAPTLVTIPGQALPSFLPVQGFGNPELEPERAWSLSGGLAWSPHEVVGLNLDFWYFDYFNRIAAESANGILAQDFADDMSFNDPRVEVVTTSTGMQQVARVRTKQLNFSQGITTSGLDFGLALRVTGEQFGGGKDDFGQLSLAGEGTYTFSYTIPLANTPDRSVPAALGGGVKPPDGCEWEGATPDVAANRNGNAEYENLRCEVSGKRNELNFAPPITHLIMNIPLTWSFEGHLASVIGRFRTGMKDDNKIVDADGNFEDIDSDFTLDVQYGYTLKDEVGKALTLRVGIQNVFDSDPALASPTTLSDGFFGDPRGRILVAQLIQEF